MENDTCMEYLFHSIESDHANNINQDILLNASNEFRNVWNLVKKLRELARVDVKKITCFLDAVQEGLQNGTWSAATRNCLQADNEYRHIRRYIRPSFLEDFKVSLYIVKSDHGGKSATKREKKQVSTSINGSRKQSFRNKQINKQDPMGNLGRKVGNESNGKKVDIKKQQALEVKGKPNENKSSKKESTNTNSGSGDGKKTDYLRDKDSLARNNCQEEISSKPSNNVGPKPDNLTSGSTKTDCRRSSENNKNKENGQSEDDENAISNNQNRNIIAREEGDGGERKQGIQEIESENESVTNRADNVKELRQEVTVKENESQDIHPEDSLKPACQLAVKTKVDTKEGDKQENNLRSDAYEAVRKDNNDVAHDMPAEEGINSSPKETISSTVENDTNTQRESHTVSVEYDMTFPIDSIKMVSERMTPISFECKPDEIITELSRVYKIDWNRAYNALTGCQPSNGIKNTIDFLGEILKLSAEDVRKALEFRDDKVSVLENLQKLKKEFLTRHLKELQKEHNIEYHNEGVDECAVNLYSAKCVELSWFMLTQNPPMVFDYDSRPMLLEDLLEIFRPYKNEGHCIHYIVWPAIRRSKYDIVVAPGIAEFR